jgi:hypothetical protein
MQRPRCGLITLEAPEGGFITPIVDGLMDNGCDVKVLHRHSQAWDVGAHDFLLTYGPMQSMAWAITRLSRSPRPPPLAVWFTEQVPAPQPGRAMHLAATIRYAFEAFPHQCPAAARLTAAPPFAALLRKAGRLRALGEMLALKSRGLLSLICAFTDTNARFLRYFGLPAEVVPMGSHPQLGARLGGLTRDIDVVFLGSTHDARRGAIIRDLEDRLRARGVNFVVKDGSPAHGHVFGRERDQLLNRAKIMLNIMRQPWDDPVFRLLLAAPAGAMLLSETLLPTSSGPFTPGRHFAQADVPRIVEAIAHYLSHDDERHAITRQAYDAVTTDLTMKNMVHKMLLALGVS